MDIPRRQIEEQIPLLSERELLAEQSSSGLEVFIQDCDEKIQDLSVLRELAIDVYKERNGEPPRNADLIYMPAPTELSETQREHWEEQYEIADRARECAMRMLGRVGVENGLAEKH